MCAKVHLCASYGGGVYSTLVSLATLSRHAIPQPLSRKSVAMFMLRVLSVASRIIRLYSANSPSSFALPTTVFWRSSIVLATCHRAKSTTSLCVVTQRRLARGDCSAYRFFGTNPSSCCCSSAPCVVFSWCTWCDHTGSGSNRQAEDASRVRARSCGSVCNKPPIHLLPFLSSLGRSYTDNPALAPIAQELPPSVPLSALSSR